MTLKRKKASQKSNSQKGREAKTQSCFSVKSEFYYSETVDELEILAHWGF